MNKEVLKVFFKPLTWFNKAIKKDEKLIFFYTNLGFRDNVKAFYDYLIRKNYNDDYRIVVSSNDYEKYIEIWNDFVCLFIDFSKLFSRDCH